MKLVAARPLSPPQSPNQPRLRGLMAGIKTSSSDQSSFLLEIEAQREREVMVDGGRRKKVQLPQRDPSSGGVAWTHKGAGALQRGAPGCNTWGVLPRNLALAVRGSHDVSLPSYVILITAVKPCPLPILVQVQPLINHHVSHYITQISSSNIDCSYHKPPAHQTHQSESGHACATTTV